jgi:hypothetical protein
MFKDMPDVLERFRVFIHDYQGEIIQMRAENDQGKIVYAFFNLAETQGKEYVSAGMITTYLNETIKMDITAQKVGKILKSLNMITIKKRYQGKQQHYITWQPGTMHKIHRRYMVDKSEFADLFENEPGGQQHIEDEEENAGPDLDIQV